MPRIIAFSSASNKQYRCLSNLAQAPFEISWPDLPCIPAHLRGQTRTYLSSEHAYQSLKTKDRRSADRLGSLSMRAFAQWPKGRGKVVDMYEKKQAYWGSRGSVGIVALMAAKLDGAVAEQALGITLTRAWTPARDFDTQLQIWEPILKAKFEQNDEARALLASTAPYTLVEAARFRRPSNYWNAYIQKADGVLVGENMMGRLLQHVRDRHFVP